MLIVLSQSMKPTIDEEELILIKQCEKYDLGDIITYVDKEEMLITHRIMQIDEYGFIAKGDNNSIIDENLPLENIQGKVIFSSKVLGRFILYYLRILIVVVIVVILMLFLIRKIMEDNKIEEKEM